MSAIHRVATVIGSTRPKRICPTIAQWVVDVARDIDALAFDVVDLQAVALPFLDEPQMASSGVYEHAHTRRWSECVSSYDAFVFVFPQYNWGYPAVLKNALDFLYHEWRDKPAGLVTYGSRGGNRGAAQLQGVLQGLHMRNTATNVRLETNAEQFDAQGAFVDVALAFERFAGDVRTMAAELAELIETPPAA